VEHERRRGVLEVQDARQRGQLVGTPDDVGDLADGAVHGRRVLLAHGDPDRVLEVPLRDARDDR
jgi:hypothetical protein